MLKKTLLSLVLALAACSSSQKVQHNSIATKTQQVNMHDPTWAPSNPSLSEPLQNPKFNQNSSLEQQLKQVVQEHTTQYNSQPKLQLLPKQQAQQQLNEAYGLYKAKQYDAAYTQLETLLQTKSLDATLRAKAEYGIGLSLWNREQAKLDVLRNKIKEEEKKEEQQFSEFDDHASESPGYKLSRELRSKEDLFFKNHGSSIIQHFERAAAQGYGRAFSDLLEMYCLTERYDLAYSKVKQINLDNLQKGNLPSSGIITSLKTIASHQEGDAFIADLTADMMLLRENCSRSSEWWEGHAENISQNKYSLVRKVAAHNNLSLNFNALITLLHLSVSQLEALSSHSFSVSFDAEKEHHYYLVLYGAFPYQQKIHQLTTQLKITSSLTLEELEALHSLAEDDKMYSVIVGGELNNYFKVPPQHNPFNFVYCDWTKIDWENVATAGTPKNDFFKYVIPSLKLGTNNEIKDQQKFNSFVMKKVAELGYDQNKIATLDQAECIWLAIRAITESVAYDYAQILSGGTELQRFQHHWRYARGPVEDYLENGKMICRQYSSGVKYAFDLLKKTGNKHLDSVFLSENYSGFGGGSEEVEHSWNVLFLQMNDGRTLMTHIDPTNYDTKQDVVGLDARKGYHLPSTEAELIARMYQWLRTYTNYSVKNEISQNMVFNFSATLYGCYNVALRGNLVPRGRVFTQAGHESPQLIIVKMFKYALDLEDDLKLAEVFSLAEQYDSKENLFHEYSTKRVAEQLERRLLIENFSKEDTQVMIDSFKKRIESLQECVQRWPDDKYFPTHLRTLQGDLANYESILDKRTRQYERIENCISLLKNYFSK